MFVTRNKICMTSKNKNIMTSLILEEMEKRGRRQVFRSEDMRLGLGFGLRFGFRFGLRFIHILPRKTRALLYTGLLSTEPSKRKNVVKGTVLAFVLLLSLLALLDRGAFYCANQIFFYWRLNADFRHFAKIREKFTSIACSRQRKEVIHWFWWHLKATINSYHLVYDTCLILVIGGLRGQMNARQNAFFEKIPLSNCFSATRCNTTSMCHDLIHSILS